MKNLILETIVYELLKEEKKISPEKLLNKTAVLYNQTTGKTLDLAEYNGIMSKLKKFRYIQGYKNHKNDTLLGN